MRCEHSANAWRMDCNNVATFGEYVANNLQQCGEHSANTWRTNCNNATFKKQKPYFCNSKTPFLHVKNHTFVMRICNIQKTNTLRTFHKCVANTPKWIAKHSAIYPHTPTKLVANRLRMRCERIAKHCWQSAKTLQNTLHHSALRTTMPQHTNIKKRIKFTTEYEKNNTNGKHLHPHFPTLICAKTPFTIEQPILVRHIHTVWRGVHRPNFNHNKRI